MLKKDIRTVNTVGRVIAEYYNNKEKIVNMAKNNETPPAYTET